MLKKKKTTASGKLVLVKKRSQALDIRGTSA